MKKILIVDDEANIRRLYSEELTEAGYRVASATSWEEAQQVLEREPFDLVTLDIRLGEGVDGIAALRLRGIPGRVRLLGGRGLYRQVLRSHRAQAAYRAGVGRDDPLNQFPPAGIEKKYDAAQGATGCAAADGSASAARS
jgi:CheY-like chemotaxis protein